MDKKDVKMLVEAIIFAADHPVSLDKLASIIEEHDRESLKGALNELKDEYSSGRGIVIEEVGGGYQLRTRPDYAPWMRKLFKIGMQRISKAALESLSIVAYKQPVTRGELEDVRGVDSGGVLKTLLDRRLIKITGRKEVPGRPVVYGTTKEFLEAFSMKDLTELPTLKEIEALEEDSVGEEYISEDEREITEDNIPGRDNLKKEGGGTDSSGQGQGQP